MIGEWVDLRGKSIKEKFIAEMLNAKAETMFASKAAEIVRKRQPKGTGMEDWDPNEVCRIQGFNKNTEIGVTVYCTLKRIYKTEYTDTEIVEKAIDVAADKVSENMLVKYGWKKGEATC